MFIGGLTVLRICSGVGGFGGRLPEWWRFGGVFGLSGILSVLSKDSLYSISGSSVMEGGE